MAQLPVGGEARGLAGVFGTSINPLSVYMQYASQRQRNKAAMAAQQKAERDKTMDYLDKFNPSSKFSELNYKINETAQRVVRDPLMRGLEQGQTLSQMQPSLQFNKGQVLGLVGESDQWKATLDGIQEEIDDDPIRYNQNAKSALRDIYLNDDGTVKEFDQIRAGIQNADSLKFDPRVLNVEGVVRAFTEKAPEQSRILLSKAYSDMGYGPDEVETMSKSGLTYELGPDGRPLLNDDMTPKVVVDENLYRLAKADPWMNSLMNAASQDKAGQMKWLKQNVTGAGDKILVDRQVIQGRKQEPDQDPRNFAWGIGFGVPVANLEARRDWLEKATSGNRPDLLKAVGNLTKDIKADYSSDKKKIVISFPSGLEDPDIMSNPKLSGILISPGKSKGTYELDISTPTAKRAARQALSEIVDSQLRDSKQAVGTDNYVRYEEAYAKNKQKGASGIKWK
jgi:hypothetical protein